MIPQQKLLSDDKETASVFRLWAACTAATLFLSVIVSPAPAAAFAGEDILLGGPWHHEDLTCRATAGDEKCELPEGIDPIYPGSGFSKEAAYAISWHADYIDSYLYNPIWWSLAIRPLKILDRYKASRTNYWDLASLHFDDLNSTAEVEATWERYMSGTLIALEWAAETNDINAAHNILGVSLHGVQDFYSHSTWINDPDRRSYSFLQVPAERRQRLTLSTGAYEATHAPIRHGEYNFACTVFGGSVEEVGRAFQLLCSEGLPTDNLGFCEKARECEQSPRDVATVSILGGETRIAVLSPPGIAMDSTWLSQIGAEQRGLAPRGSLPLNQASRPGRARGKSIYPMARNLRSIDPGKNCRSIIAHDKDCRLESDFLFAEAKHLASVSSHQWLGLIDQYMTARRPDFWSQVKTCRSERDQNVCHGEFDKWFPPSGITGAFEDYSKFPFQFLTAGNDTPAAPAESEGWYLRVDLKTSDVSGAGTDADIYIEADGKRFLLDNLNARDPASKIRSSLLVYNDFERNDHQVFTVGPLTSLPQSVKLINDASSRKEVRRAFREAFKRRMRNGWDTFVHVFRNDQDYVGLIDQALGRTQLDQIIQRGGNFHGAPGGNAERGIATFRINGGVEGIYDVRMRVSRTNWRGREAKRNWAEYRLELVDIYCVEESDVDGFSRSDEPYFFFALSAYGLSDPKLARFGPFENIGTDRRDERRMTLNHVLGTVRLPQDGLLHIANQTYEHDNERSSDRDSLYAQFSTSFDTASVEDYNTFLAEWGRTLGGDWKVHRLKIHAFKRGPSPEYGLVYDRVHNVWIEEEESRSFTLDKARLRSLNVNLSGITTRSNFGDPRLIELPTLRPDAGVQIPRNQRTPKLQYQKPSSE